MEKSRHGCFGRFGKGLGTRLSILRSILSETQEYRAGRDDIDAIGDVLASKSQVERVLFHKENAYDSDNRKAYYELFSPDKFMDALEADLVEIFESELNS